MKGRPTTTQLGHGDLLFRPLREIEASTSNNIRLSPANNLLCDVRQPITWGLRLRLAGVFRPVLWIVNKWSPNRKTIQESHIHDSDEPSLERTPTATESVQIPQTASPIESHKEPQQLEGLLSQALVESSAPSFQSFIPEQTLLNIVTEEAVERDLRLIKRTYSLWNGFKLLKGEVRLLKCLRVSLGLINVQKMARQICGMSSFHGRVQIADPKLQKSHEGKLSDKSYQKVFAVMILIGFSEGIMSFIEEEICDADLPLVKTPRKHSSKGSKTLRRRNNDRPLKCVAKWSDRRLSDFEKWQWRVLAPCFAWSKDQQIEHQSFEAERILPFMFRQKTPRCGGFGQVYEVHIHSSHHTFHDPEVCIIYLWFCVITNTSENVGSWNLRRERAVFRE